MSPPTLLLDTNILWHLDLCERLTAKIQANQLRVCIPTLVHAERIRQVADQYGERFAIDVVRQFVADAQFELLPLSVQDAEQVADIWLALKAKGQVDKYWTEHRFDILVCAIALATGYILITEDSGSHYDMVAERLHIRDLANWLETLP